MKTERQSFTMIELLTVVAIIAVLAGIAVGVANLIADKSASAKTEGTIKALELALNMYKDQFGHYLDVSITPSVIKIPADIPTTNFDGSFWKFLDQKLINTTTVKSGGYRYFKDGWDNPLVYRSPGKFNKTTFDLGSSGPDGMIGDGATTKISVNTSTWVITDIHDYDTFGKDDDVVNFIHNSN